MRDVEEANAALRSGILANKDVQAQLEEEMWLGSGHTRRHSRSTAL